MKLHLGCGKRNFGKEWIHVDNGSYPHLDHKCEINHLDFCFDETVDLIYASHVLEYYDRSQVIEVLQEWYRVLKPNGILRIAVPDFEMIASLYLTHKTLLPTHKEDFTLDNVLGPLYGRMDMDGIKIYHKTCYDFESLQTLLTQCQRFKDVERYDWRKTEHAHIDDHSQAYWPHMNKENGILISLNVQCKK